VICIRVGKLNYGSFLVGYGLIKTEIMNLQGAYENQNHIEFGNFIKIEEGVFDNGSLTKGIQAEGGEFYDVHFNYRYSYGENQIQATQHSFFKFIVSVKVEDNGSQSFTAKTCPPGYW
jgi:hypothetical protein